MKKINLRDYYPFYKEDFFIEVEDQIAELLKAFDIQEASYQRYIRRYKAYYSLDVDNGIENSILLTAQTPDEIYERKLTKEQLYRGLNSIPKNLRFAVSAGIGMFIAFIGLKNSGIIVSNEATFVTLGKFTSTATLGIIAIVLSGVFMARRVKGALFYAIIIATIAGIPMGVTNIPEGWLPVSAPHSLSPIFCQFDFNGFFSLQTVLVVFSLLMVNIFDTIGTLVGLAEKTGIVKPDGSIPRVSEAMMSDAIGTTCGAVLGSSTITTYVESASGIAEGGRSGMTSFVTGMLFVVSLLLSPLFLLIPGSATSGALVLVGVLMLDSVKKIDLSDVSEAFPAFITMITMVLCYSIADGICLGILSFVIIKVCTAQWKALNPTLIVLSLLFIINFLFK